MSSSVADASAVSKTKSVIKAVRETVHEWLDDKAMRLSAALSLYTLLSLAPLLVLTLKVVGVVVASKDTARIHITQQVTSLMGQQAAQAITPIIDNSGKQGNGVLAAIISTAVLAFSATGVFIELQDSMNTVWGVKPKPNLGIWEWVRNRLLSLGMVFGVGFLLLVSMFISTVLAGLARYVVGERQWIAILTDIVVSLAVVSLLFAAIFKFLPDVKLRWRHVWLGAFLTAGLFTVGKFALALYFKYAAPTSAFGAAGSLAAVMLWVYYSSFILFFGAEFTKVWSKRQLGERVEPDDHAVKMGVVDRARQGLDPVKPVNSSPQPAGALSNSITANGQGRSPYAAAAGGLFVGALAGGFGMRYLFIHRRPKVRSPRRVRRAN